jgi:hypothetical protein
VLDMKVELAIVPGVRKEQEALSREPVCAVGLGSVAALLGKPLPR